MNVGNPSNMERVLAVYPKLDELPARRRAPISVTEDEIRARIRTDFARYGQVWCPHTAVAAEAYERLPAERKAKGRWVLVSTAHPAKFREIVEPLARPRDPGPRDAGAAVRAPDVR